jgi:4a-hydroxytetrahydrobiopterin dehydratase
MPRTRASTAEEIDAFLAVAPQWSREGDALVRTVEAPSFRIAISWVVAVGDVAELLDHHPDVDIRWRTLTFRLTSHDLGGISPRDLELAQMIDSIVAA